MYNMLADENSIPFYGAFMFGPTIVNCSSGNLDAILISYICARFPVSRSYHHFIYWTVL